MVACEALVPSESYTLKAEYLNLDRLLDNPRNLGRQAPPSWVRFLMSSDYQLSPEMLTADPPEPEALVGPYLKRLPAEFPDDEKHETIAGARGTEIDTGQGPN